MSELVDFEDLCLLDGRDLLAVFEQATNDQVLDALVGITPGLRQSLLIKLAPQPAARLRAQLADYGPVAFESVKSAQQALIAALCRLSREGLIAFHNPEDMVA